MATRTLELDLAVGPRRNAVVTPERLGAVLRWRARWLRRTLPQKSALSLRLLPALLQASFPYRDLRSEAPGIDGLGVRRCWGVVARAFDLPPPISRQRGRRLVSALLAIPAADGLHVYALAVAGAGPHELERLHARIMVAQDILTGAGVPLRLAVLPATSADPAAEPLLRALPFGALIAGRIPKEIWDAPADPARNQAGCAALARLAMSAPTPFCELALSLMTGAPALLPAAALKLSLEQGVRTLELADPEFFCASWAGAASQDPQLLFRLLATCSPNPRSRQAAAEIAGPATPGFGGVAVAVAPTTRELLELGRRLACKASSAVRRAPQPGRVELLKRLRRDVIGFGLPKVLLGPMAQALRALGVGRARGSLLRTVPRPGPSFEVHDASQATLSRGRRAEQAQVRALALVARALGGLPPEVSDDRVWRLIGAKLLRPCEKRSLFLVIPPAMARGAPHDPLNRGLERRCGFGDPIALLLRPGGRPSALKLPPEEAVAMAVIEAWRGTVVEVQGSTGDAQPAAARVQRATNLARPGELVGAPPALEVGGRVLYLEERGMRRFRLDRFAARPRQCYPDPEAPDLSPWAEDNLRSSAFGSRATITCHATKFGDDTAGVLYVDPEGFQLREQVPLSLLQEHLDDAQALLRAEPSPMLLSLRCSKEIEHALGRHPAGTVEARVDIEVFGTLPFGLQVQIRGERFGRGQPLGWQAAAQSVLAGWPSGATGRVAVKGVHIDIACKPAGGLARLYARSLIVRRLDVHVRLACRR